MKQGDIILVPFPFTDFSSNKTRPALVISCNKKRKDIIIVAITSKKDRVSVRIETSDLTHGVLPVISYVRYDKIVTLHESLVRKVVAKVRPSKLRIIVSKFKKLF